MIKAIIKTNILTGIIITLAAGCSNTSTTRIAAPENQDDKKEYMVTVTRPGTTLHLIDLQTDTVVNQCKTDIGPGPGTIVVSPDKQIAYVLTDHFSDVYGINMDTCQVVFSTNQSLGNVRVKSFASVALSKDGKEIYIHQNRVRLLNDHYEILPPKIAVFDTSRGLKVKASRTFDAPRQITTMDTLESGDLIAGGQDIYQMNVKSGEYRVLLKSLHRSDPKYAPRDVLTVWQTGKINNEFFRLYSTAKFADDSQNIDTAEWLWGYERVDLKTGKAESQDMGPLTAVLFTGVRRPGQLNKVYGTLNQIKEYNTDTLEETRSVDLEHTYYAANFNHDGSKLYLGGAYDDIAVYDADTLTKLTNIQLTGDGSMATNVIFKR